MRPTPPEGSLLPSVCVFKCYSSQWGAPWGGEMGRRQPSSLGVGGECQQWSCPLGSLSRPTSLQRSVYSGCLSIAGCGWTSYFFPPAPHTLPAVRCFSPAGGGETSALGPGALDQEPDAPCTPAAALGAGLPPRRPRGLQGGTRPQPPRRYRVREREQHADFVCVVWTPLAPQPWPPSSTLGRCGRCLLLVRVGFGVSGQRGGRGHQLLGESCVRGAQLRACPAAQQGLE